MFSSAVLGRDVELRHSSKAADERRNDTILLVLVSSFSTVSVLVSAVFGAGEEEEHP